MKPPELAWKIAWPVSSRETGESTMGGPKDRAGAPSGGWRDVEPRRFARVCTTTRPCPSKPTAVTLAGRGAWTRRPARRSRRP